MWYILWGPTTPHTKTYRKDPELNRMWEIFEHAWGSPETEENVSALSQLAITDGVMDLVEPPGDDTGYIGIEIDAPVASVAYGSESLLGDGDGGEHQEMEVEIGETSSVTTTEPEQTAESDIQECPDGMSPEEWNSFRTKYPRLAQPNPDGTQPDSMSPPATQPSPPSSAECCGSSRRNAPSGATQSWYHWAQEGTDGQACGVEVGWFQTTKKIINEQWDVENKHIQTNTYTSHTNSWFFFFQNNPKQLLAVASVSIWILGEYLR